MQLARAAAGDLFGCPNLILPLASTPPLCPAAQMDAELHVAGTLQAHLARLDDALMKVQKERGADMKQSQV